MQKKSGPAAKELKTEDDLLLAQEANEGSDSSFPMKLDKTILPLD